MKIVEALRSLKRIREAREELFRAYNDGGFFSRDEKTAIENAISVERERIVEDIKVLAKPAKKK